jgi:ketosteroid isomerase-like protein
MTDVRALGVELVTAMTSGDLVSLRRLLAADVVFHLPGITADMGRPSERQGIESILDMVGGSLSSSKGLAATHTPTFEQVIAEDDRVVALVMLRGPLADGGEYANRYAYVMRFQGDRVVEGWMLNDTAYHLKNLSVSNPTANQTKFEYMSSEWVNHARSFVTRTLRDVDLSGIEVEFCEELTNAPSHLANGGQSIGWHLVIRDGQVRVGAGVIDAQTKVVASYSRMLPLARTAIDHADPEAVARLERTAATLIAEGALVPPADYGGTPAARIPELAGLHNEMAAHTI